MYAIRSYYDSRRKKKAKKERKRILRQMKEIVKVVQKHAERYRELLLSRREETDLTEKQATQIIMRIDNILNQLPQAVKQAHDRIIGNRSINNEDKILTLYEDEIHVIVRGKAGAEVEFGNGLVLVEHVITSYSIHYTKLYDDTTIEKSGVQVYRAKSLSH